TSEVLSKLKELAELAKLNEEGLDKLIQRAAEAEVAAKKDLPTVNKTFLWEFRNKPLMDSDGYYVDALATREAVKIRNFLALLLRSVIPEQPNDDILDIFRRVLHIKMATHFIKDSLTNLKENLKKKLAQYKQTLFIEAIREMNSLSDRKEKVNEKAGKVMQNEFILESLNKIHEEFYEKWNSAFEEAKRPNAKQNTSDLIKLFLLKDQCKRAHNALNILDVLQNIKWAGYKKNYEEIDKKFQTFLDETTDSNTKAQWRIAEIQVDIVQKIWRKEWGVSIGGEKVSIVGDNELKYRSTVPTGVAEMITVLKSIQMLEKKEQTAPDYEKALEDIQKIARKRLTSSNRWRTTNTEEFYKGVCSDIHPKAVAIYQLLQDPANQLQKDEKKILVKIFDILKDADGGKSTYQEAFRKVGTIIALSPKETNENKSKYHCCFAFFLSHKKATLPHHIHTKIERILNGPLPINENTGDRHPSSPTT
ncbi:MAG: hypothetical protein WBE18_00265, partial [Gammaproteobacteria bacterium]